MKTMKQNHFLAAILSLALMTGCSSEEIVKESVENESISFSITANKNSRSAEFYCNNNLPSDFYASAFVDKGDGTLKNYMSYEHFQENNGIWKIVGDERYWPGDGTKLKIYASNRYAYEHINCSDMTKYGDNIDRSGVIYVNLTSDDNYRCISYTPPMYSNDQIDVLYSYTEQGKPEFGKTASINFRHALSMIVFKAKNSLGHAQVKIDEIRLFNLAQAGWMRFPTKPTDLNYVDHTGKADYPEEATVCTWPKDKLTHGTQGGADTRYFYTKLPQTVVLNNGELKNLTDNDLVDGKETNYANVFLQIPETFPAWDHSVNKFPIEQRVGAFIYIKCSIQNIADKTATEPSADDVYIYSDNGKTKYLALPLNVDWKPGKKYIYTINFNGKNGGGYDPSTGEEVLVPIEFTVTVDDFADAKNNDTNI